MPQSKSNAKPTPPENKMRSGPEAQKRAEQVEEQPQEAPRTPEGDVDGVPSGDGWFAKYVEAQAKRRERKG